MVDQATRSRIEDNIASARQQIAQAAAQAGRDADDILLVAVSKTVGVDEVQVAIDAGIHDFGENRTAELKLKQQAYPDQRWHMIGRIQTNKLKDVVGRACLIHSVASEHAADTIEKLAAKLDIVQPILLEVNVSGEQSKDGLEPDQVDQMLRHCATLQHVQVRGFMTMAPLGQVDYAKTVFARLRELRDTRKVVFEDCGNINLVELSMGMTQDFDQAIVQGATMIRLGRSIFA